MLVVEINIIHIKALQTTKKQQRNNKETTIGTQQRNKISLQYKDEKKKKKKKKEDKCYDTASTRIKNKEEIFQAAYHVGKIPQLLGKIDFFFFLL